METTLQTAYCHFKTDHDFSWHWSPSRLNDPTVFTWYWVFWVAPSERFHWWPSPCSCRRPRRNPLWSFWSSPPTIHSCPLLSPWKIPAEGRRAHSGVHQWCNVGATTSTSPIVLLYLHLSSIVIFWKYSTFALKPFKLGHCFEGGSWVRGSVGTFIPRMRVLIIFFFLAVHKLVRSTRFSYQQY